ncbi:MAG: hypothetical protein TEF_19970 [Rhizobiales bacterium NRL2]|jgi:predicted MFS family arabinose efflux permease|nr:MAG: hypothetical protein TEF_19970 [Rhizobiales bacterium NRL2]
MKALWGLALGNFAVGTGALVVAGVLPDIARDLGVPDARSGHLISLYAIAYALGAPLLGSLTGGFDRRRLLVGAAALIAVANTVAAVAASFDLLLFARIASALGAAIFSPIGAAVASTLVPPERVARALSLVFGGFVVATVLGVPLGTWLGGNFGWPVTFWFVAALAAGATISALVTVPKGLKARGAGFRPLIAVLSNHRMVLALSVGVGHMACQFIPYTFIALILSQRSGADTNDITVVLLLFGLFSFIGNIVGGRITDRFGTTVTILGGLFTLPVIFAGFDLLDTGVIAACIMLSVWGAAGFSFAVAQQARLVGLAPEQSSTALSLHASSMYLGQALGALVGAQVLRGMDLYALQWFALAGALLTLTLFLISRRQWRGR